MYKLNSNNILNKTSDIQFTRLYKTIYRIKLILILFIIINILTLNFFNTLTSFAIEPNITSSSALTVEISTGKIIYEKNAHERMYPASTTKILTALLILENCNLNDIATVSYNATSNIPSGYTTAKLQVGEQLTIEDLLYALMLPSANDAAVVLAEHLAGSVDSFSSMMNTRALELGCETTHFVNPNGIHSEDHYSSAYDLYLIANEAMKNPIFRKMVSTTSYTLPATEQYPNNDRTFTNTNQLIIVNNNDRPDNYYYKYAIGIKTGFTTPAKNCLVSASSRDGLEFITVILGAGATEDGYSARYLDSIHLFDYAYDNYTFTNLKKSGDYIQTIEIPNGTKETKNLNLKIQDSISLIINKNIDVNSIIPIISLNENLLAPISENEVIGTIEYNIDGIKYSSKLLASNSVEPKKNYSIYLIISGFILLIIALGLMFKKGKRTKQNHRHKQQYYTRY